MARFTVDHVPTKSKPGVRFLTGKLSVRFADDQPLYFQIKHLMKTSLQTNSIHPALFQIAARIGAPRPLRVSKSSLPVDYKIWTTFGIDSKKSNPAEITKNFAQRRVHFHKNAGIQTGV
jgi:hypothetical protein